MQGYLQAAAEGSRPVCVRTSWGREEPRNKMSGSVREGWWRCEVLLVQDWRGRIESSLDWCKVGRKREGEAKEGERRRCVECDGEQRGFEA